MRMRALAAFAAAGMLALAGCAASPSGSAVDVCESQKVEGAPTGALEWDGGQVEGRDGVFEYTSTLTLDDVEVIVSCLVAATQDGFVLQDFDAEVE
jgi:hypothetical protein